MIILYPRLLKCELDFMCFLKLQLPCDQCIITLAYPITVKLNFQKCSCTLTNMLHFRNHRISCIPVIQHHKRFNNPQSNWSRNTNNKSASKQKLCLYQPMIILCNTSKYQHCSRVWQVSIVQLYMEHCDLHRTLKYFHECKKYRVLKLDILYKTLKYFKMTGFTFLIYTSLVDINILISISADVTQSRVNPSILSKTPFPKEAAIWYLWGKIPGKSIFLISYN